VSPTNINPMLQHPGQISTTEGRSETVDSARSTAEHYEAVSDAAFVGRDRALAVLRAAVDEAVAGRGRLVLVTGEAGIGKTALAVEAARYAGEHGAGLLGATCWDGEGAPAYWPWVQILRASAAAHGPLPSDVARILPTVAAEGVSNPLSPAAGAGERERFLLFDAVGTMLRQAAGKRPLLLVIDDLQWADIPSLLLLKFLAAELSRTPLLILGAYRDDEVRADPPRRWVLADIRRHGEPLALSGLAVDDVARLMGTVGGTRPDEAVVAEVFRRTAGNPFFVREVTQLLGSRDGTFGSGGGIPEGVRQVIEQRLARLPQPCMSILTMAAVAGRETGTDVLARAVGRESSEVIELLEQAVQAQVFAQPPGPAGPYRFTHDLFRETVYAALPARARAEHHRRLAEALDAAGADSPTGPSAELARHFLLAAAGLSSSKLSATAVRYCLRAAHESVERLAYEDAVGHCSKALEGLGLAGILGEEDRLELLLTRGDALRRAGEVARARGDYDQAVELARAGAASAQLARAALGVHALGVESGASRDVVVDLLDEALDGFDDEDSALRAKVLACLARELYLSGVAERVRAARLSSAAVEIARRVGDQATLALCLLASPRHDLAARHGRPAAGYRR
jgi:predicted ATPase